MPMHYFTACPRRWHVGAGVRAPPCLTLAHGWRPLWCSTPRAHTPSREPRPRRGRCPRWPASASPASHAQGPPEGLPATSPVTKKNKKEEGQEAPSAPCKTSWGPWPCRCRAIRGWLPSRPDQAQASSEILEIPALSGYFFLSVKGPRVPKYFWPFHVFPSILSMVILNHIL